MALSNTTVMAADLQTYFSQKLLEVAQINTEFKKYAMLAPIPSASSKTISFTQYARLTPPSGVLTEGVVPTSNVLSATALTATVDQIGDYVILTDLAVLTLNHPILTETTYLMGLEAAQSYDNRIQAVLVAGTNTQYANGKASRATLVAGDVMTTVEFQKAIRTMRQNGASAFDDGNYVMLVDPSVEQDILADTKFNTAAAYSQVDRVNQAEVGKWFGITVVRSNNILPIANTPTVHTSYVIGRNAFAASDLQNLAMFIEGPGSVADPLHQQRTVGWKYSQKTVILNQNWLLRIESASAF